MILNKYSLNGKMHPHFNFETLYIKFQEEFLKFAFFQKLVLKFVNAIKAFDLCVFRFIMFYCVFGVFVILLSLCFMFYDLLVLVRISF